MQYPVFGIIIGIIATFLVATLLSWRIGSGSFPLPNEDRRIGCVDGLRGYLALSVLIHHVIVWTQITRLGGSWSPPAVNAFNELGAGSVGLFFMVTGLVFYPRILCGFRKTPWPAVYVTRAFRIVPLQLASILIVTIVIAVKTHRGLDTSYPSALAHWIAGQSEPDLLRYPDSGRVNAYVLWSLGYEWLFYLFLLPACALAADILRNRMPTFVVPAALFSAGVFLQLAWRPATLGRLPFYLPLFAVGMIAFECRERERIRGALCSRTATIAALAALAVAINISAFPYAPAALLLFGFFFTCVASGNSFGGVLKTKGALVLGEISFGIYLLHGIIVYLLFAIGEAAFGRLSPGAGVVVVSTGASMIVVALASLAHLYIELPGIRAGSRLANLWARRRGFLRAPELQVAP